MYGGAYYGEIPYGGSSLSTPEVPPQPTGHYTGRLGHPFSQPSWIKLGFNLPVQPPRPPRPWPDMMTHLTLAPHQTEVATFARTTAVEVLVRRTSVTPDV